MIDQQQDVETAFPSLLGLLGVAGIGFLTCIAGGFFVAAIAYVIVQIMYHIVVIAAYLVSHMIALWRINREIAAARAIVGASELPAGLQKNRLIWADSSDKLPAGMPASRLIWTDRSVAV